MTRQCLHLRIDDLKKISSELAIWERERYIRSSKIRWYFTNNPTREMMSSFYPEIENQISNTEWVCRRRSFL